jgi:hypothetical protein
MIAGFLVNRGDCQEKINNTPTKPLSISFFRSLAIGEKRGEGRAVIKNG